LADVHITYLAPIHFGQKIEVGVRVARIGNKSMIWKQNILDTGNDTELAKGEVVLVAYDYHEKKTIAIPQTWRQKFLAFEGLKLEK
jgi:acyl-CoA thioester hydrolase